MAKPLQERLQAALAPGARTTDVSALITTVIIELRVAEAERDRQHAIAVSVTSDDATADAAADAELKAIRRVERLSGQRDQLKARVEELREAEARRAAEIERAEITAERDQLAKDLREHWPKLEAVAVALLARLRANDEGCARINISSAEAVARDCPGHFMIDGVHIPRLTQSKLNGFEAGAGARPVWPPEPHHSRIFVDA